MDFRYGTRNGSYAGEWDGPAKPLNIGPDGKILRDNYSDGMALPRELSFNALIEGGFYTYFHGSSDEAIRFNRCYALDLLRDTFIRGLIDERIRSVSCMAADGWHLEVPNEKDTRQVYVRDHLTKAIKQMFGLADLIKYIGWRTWYGRMGVQLMWGWQNVEGLRTLVPQQTIPVNGDKIIYEFNDRPCILVNSAHPLPGAEYVPATNDGGPALKLKGSWRNRFIITQWNCMDEDYFNAEQMDAIHGRGLRSLCFWSWWLKQEWLARISDFIDRVGMGLTIWRYAFGNPESKLAVENAMKEQSGRVNISLPTFPGSQPTEGVERIEVPVAGAELLMTMIEPFKQELERLIVGQEGSAKGKGGGDKDTAFRMETKAEITLDDAIGTAEALTGNVVNPGLVSVMQQYTHPDTVPWKPNGFQVRFVFDVQQVDAEKKLEAAAKVFAMGGKIKADQARGYAGLSKPSDGDEVLQQNDNAGGLGMTPRPAPDPSLHSEDGSRGGHPPRPAGSEGGLDNDPVPAIKPAQFKKEKEKDEKLAKMLKALGLKEIHPGVFVVQEEEEEPDYGMVQYVRDEQGHEHKGTGEGGGQFTGTASGDSPERNEKREKRRAEHMAKREAARSERKAARKAERIAERERLAQEEKADAEAEKVLEVYKEAHEELSEHKAGKHSVGGISTDVIGGLATVQLNGLLDRTYPVDDNGQDRDKAALIEAYTNVANFAGYLLQKVKTAPSPTDEDELKIREDSISSLKELGTKALKFRNRTAKEGQ